MEYTFYPADSFSLALFVLLNISIILLILSPLYKRDKKKREAGYRPIVEPAGGIDYQNPQQPVSYYGLHFVFPALLPLTAFLFYFLSAFFYIYRL